MPKQDMSERVPIARRIIAEFPFRPSSSGLGIDLLERPSPIMANAKVSVLQSS